MLVLSLRLSMIIGLFLLSAAQGYAENVRIGVALPLSGSNEAQGKAMLYGLQLYFDVLQEEEATEYKYELVVRDDQNDPAKAQQIAQEFAADRTILAVIGHQFSSVALAAGEVYEQQKLLNISPSASNRSVTRGRNWVFSMNYHDNLQGEFIANYIKAILELRNIIVIHTDDPYGQGLQQSFSRKARHVGLEILKAAAFSQEDKYSDQYFFDIRTEISEPIEGIVLLTHTEDGPALIKQIRRNGLDVPIIGPDSYTKTEFINALGEDKENIFVTSPFLYELASLKTKQFIDLYIERYYKKFGIAHTLWSAFMYDAAYLIDAAIQHVGPDRQAIRDHIAQRISSVKALDGITGDLFFDRHGALQRNVVVSVIERDSFKPAYAQLREVNEVHILNNLARKILFDEVVVLNGKPFYRTQVVYTGLDFFRINNIDISEQRFDVEFFLWFKWTGELDVENIDFLNSIFSEENVKEVLREDQSGPVKYIAYKMKNAFLTPYDLRTFPFDLQHLPMTLSHKTKDANQVSLVVDSNNLSSQALEAIYPEEWKYRGRLDFSGTYSQHSTFGDPSYTEGVSKADFSVYESNILIRRILLPYFLTLFLPLALLILITLLLFVIPVDQFDARLTIVMTALLSILVFHMAQGDSLPNVGYLVMADIYFILSYVLMFALIINIVYVNRLAWQGNVVQARQHNKIFSWFFVPIAIISFLLLTMRSV